MGEERERIRRRDCGCNEWIQKTFFSCWKLVDCACVRVLCLLVVAWLTQFAEELHSQRSVDEEEQHEEETEISHLEGMRMLDLPLHINTTV